LFVRKNGAALPAAAVSPVVFGSERSTWYQVTAGAYTTRNQADSLLLALRSSGIIRDTTGVSVTRTPLALIVDSVPTQGGSGDAVTAVLDKYAARGLQVYALIQDDGGALIYSGAFARADQSAPLIRTLRGAGLKPVLVYRTGERLSASIEARDSRIQVVADRTGWCSARCDRDVGWAAAASRISDAVRWVAPSSARELFAARRWKK
jgi:hypothetical protein